jgi:hypothetical protein
MLNRRAILLAIALGLWCAVTPTNGQAFTPVDQTVGDLDLRARSLRHVEQGIGEFGQSGSLYRRQGFNPWSVGSGQPLTQQYQFRQPGVTAWIDRPDYLVLDEFGQLRMNTSPAQDRRFLGLIPPNTVFDLTLPVTVRLDPDARAIAEGWRDTRINTRINGTINTRYSVETSSRIGDLIGRTFPLPPRAYKVPMSQPEADDASKPPPDEPDGAPSD